MPGSVLQFPIRLGLDEGTNPKALEPGRLKEAINVQFDKNGRLAKRYAVRPLGSSVANGRRLVTRGSELSVVSVDPNTGATLSTYLPESASWVESDSVPDVGLTWKTILDDHRGVRSTDFAVSGRKLLHAWVTGDPTSTERRGDLWYQILDTETDEVRSQPVRLEQDVSRVRIVLLEGFAFILSVQTTGILRYTSINMATLAQVTSAEITSDISAGLLFDAVAGGPGTSIGSPSLLLLAREVFPHVVLNMYSQSAGTLVGQIDSDVVGTLVNDASALGVGCSETTAWAVYTADNEVSCRGYTVSASTLTSNGVRVAIEAAFHGDQVSVQWITATTALVAYSGRLVSQPLPVMWSRTVQANATVTGRREIAASMSICSRIFRRLAPGAASPRYFVFASSVKLAPIALAPPNTCTYLLELKPTGALDPSPITMVGKVDDGIGGAPTLGSLPTCVQMDGTTLLAPLFYQATAAPSDFVWRCGIRQVRVAFDGAHPPDFWHSIEIGQEAYIETGIFAAWDGRVVFDAGMREPDVDLVTFVGGGDLAAGKYIYQIMVSYRSYAGVYHRGPPMIPITQNVASAGSRVQARLLSHAIDGKTGGETRLAGVLYEIYRSILGGSNAQRLTFEPTYNTVFNDPVVTSVVFTDTRADSDITGGGEALTMPLDKRPVIYTATGELEDVQAPAPYTSCFHQGRVFLVTGGRREVWWSKDIDENPGFAPGFHPTQRFVFETDLTALWSLDDKLVIASEDDLWYVLGDGPNVSGQDNRFSVPRAIQTDVGCTNPRSVVSIPIGTIFEGRRGLYLLTRDLQVIEFGDRVRDTLEAFPKITSAVLVSSLNEVRFTCNAESGMAGRVVVYDYLRKEWLVRDYGTPIADACVHAGVWTFVTPSGQVYQEDSTTHLDGGTDFVPSTVTFAPISNDGPASWKRIKAAYLVGQSISNHALTMTVKRDFSTVVEQSETFPAGSEVTALSTLERARIDLAVQKVQAVEISISDAAPEDPVAYPLGNGAGFVLEGFALVVQPKPGLPRDSAGRRG